MTKKAWKVELDLIDRFLNVLTDNGFEWMSGDKANKFKPLCTNDTIMFTEWKPKTLTWMEYSSYLDDPHEEYNITEVTEEWLRVMEYDGVVRTFVPETLRKDIWKIICDVEEDECEHDPVNHPEHYNRSGIETIKIIEMFLTEEEYRGFLKGNILKYRERAPYKGNAEQDYEKARWYFDELMRIGF